MDEEVNWSSYQVPEGYRREDNEGPFEGRMD